MSRSSVVTGAPWRIPAVMPTTMNSTSLVASRRRTSANRACFIQCPDFESGFHEGLDSPEALLRREREHGTDLGTINAVGVDVDLPRGDPLVRRLAMLHGS